MKRVLGVVAVVAQAAFMAAACNFIRVTGGDQTQGQEITSPSASPSPVAPCELASLQAGTEGDARTIVQGTTLGVGVSLLGTQGVELPATCAAQYTVAWSGGEPCILSATGQAGVLTAPESAPIGSVCAFRAAAGALASTVSVQVVAP